MLKKKWLGSQRNGNARFILVLLTHPTAWFALLLVSLSIPIWWLRLIAEWWVQKVDDFEGINLTMIMPEKTFETIQEQMKEE